MKLFKSGLNKVFISVASLSLALLLVAPSIVNIGNHVDAVSQNIGNKVVNPKKFHKDVIHIKLSSDITLDNGLFVGSNLSEVSELNNLLNQSGKSKIAKLSQTKPQNALHKKVLNSIDGYYKVTFKSDIDVLNLVSQLKQLNIVMEAYAEPTPAPAPGKPVKPGGGGGSNFVSSQNYLLPSPQGIDSNFATTYPGGSGVNTKIIDIEYSWNINHEDLTKARTAMIPNGTPSDPFNDNNHGTAVLGELIADNNNIGVTGTVPNAQLGLINAYNLERGYDLVGALQLAAQHTSPGDVILIEQQTWGPTPDTYDYVPVEWIPEVYDAIAALTAGGVIVIEPAGNGYQNLDNAQYYGTTFPMNKPDSGAIVVGAAHNCSASPRLSRMSYSSYGSRVNLQGPGECVTTTGYGYLSNSGGVNALYTASFNGTSSASPVIAGAVASLSSAYDELNNNELNAVLARNILISNSTPQNTNGSVLQGNIGPYPDLARALLKTDTLSPSAPTNLQASVTSRKRSISVNLSWGSSSDNVQVSNYKLYRNGLLYATLSSGATSYNDSNVTKGQTYSYYLVAIDMSGNISANSNMATAKP